MWRRWGQVLLVVGMEVGMVIYLTYLHNWNMSNSPNSGPNVGNTSGVGETSAIEELWVSLSGGEGEESGAEDEFDHGVVVVVMRVRGPGCLPHIYTRTGLAGPGSSLSVQTFTPRTAHWPDALPSGES